MIIESWNGFKLDAFEFMERQAKIVCPDNFNGRIVFKTEYWDSFPNFEIEMVKRGYCLINITHTTRWGAENEIDIMAEFVKMVAAKLDADCRCILVGMSCGGLQAALFAEKYPELTAAMYLDAPVLNILSLAGLGECECPETLWRELVSTYGFSRSTVINFRKSPIDNMEPLIKNDIPVIMLYGNADTAVIYEENGKVLEEYYKNNGGTIKVISKSMCKHHPHCLEDPQIIIDFVEKYMK